MRYPKKGEAVWVVGELYKQHGPWVMVPARTPALVVASGIDPMGRTLLLLPMQGEVWAHAYQIIYPDTNLCADGQPRWDNG